MKQYDRKAIEATKRKVKINMEYAMNKNGKLVHHINASRELSYVCPYCFEKAVIRQGANACFYHNPIRDRTPLQRTCPEYHENSSYRKVNDRLEILYINNGGIPLYLCNENERFQLRAYFPKISEHSVNKLKRIGVKIHVNTKAYSEMDKKIYNVCNLNFYPVSTIEKWIFVECNPFVVEPEVKRKWLSGIRGVDVERDIYHSNQDGGYRVALKANITVAKAYQIMFKNSPPIIKGISFEKKGEIHLRKKMVRKVVGIYEMRVEKFAEPARQFVEGKGYKLVEDSNELIPLWPPAIFKGNEIIFNERDVFFLHINNSMKERLFYTRHNGLIKMDSTEENKRIVPIIIHKDEGKSLAVSDGDDARFDHEIKYNLLYRSPIITKKPINQRLAFTDIDGSEVNLVEDNPILPKNGQLLISSKVPFMATISSNNYTITSGSKYLEDIYYGRVITIDSKAFGIKTYSLEKEILQKRKEKQLDWEQQYAILYRCTGTTIKADARFFQILLLLSKNTNDININLYRLLETWVKTNSIPVTAIKYIDGIARALGGMVNE